MTSERATSASGPPSGDRRAGPTPPPAKSERPVKREPPYVLAVIAAVAAGALGPRYYGERDRAAGGAFEYTPPPGFEPVVEEQAPTTSDGTERRVWQRASPSSGGTVRLTLIHATQLGGVGPADLAELSRKMPAAFDMCVPWDEVRHETRRRADGARVGVIEGACVVPADDSDPMRTVAAHMRTVQLLFPDDRGMSVVTSMAPADAAELWVPQIEATIASARGVAVRVGKRPMWVSAAWGIAGGLVVLVLASLRRPVARRG